MFDRTHMVSRRFVLQNTPWLFQVGILAAQDLLPPLWPGFQERAMAQVRRLSERAARIAGSSSEAQARRYVSQQLAKAGLSVSKEAFRFRTFSLRKATMSTGDQQFQVVRLGFDPYTNGLQIEGPVIYVEPATNDSSRAYADLDLENRIVVTHSDARFFPLMGRRPRARDHSSITLFTQSGTGTVRMCPPLPTRSTMAQCSSRRWR
jgi:hypothetical protein